MSHLGSRLLSVLLGLLLFAPACFGQAQSDTDPVLDDLAKKASEIRGLSFKEPLQFGKFENGEAMREFFQEEFERAYPSDVLPAMNRAYRRMGLMRDDEEVSKSMMDMMLSQVAGLYDPRTKKMYIVWDLSPDLHMVQTIFIHEIVHALQDQNFDLLSLPIESIHADDRASAAMALIEGDATFSMMKHVPEKIDPMSLSAELLLTTIVGSSDVGSAPHIFQKQMFFAYLSGMHFVEQIASDKGDGSTDWDAVNAVYADPPQSTEQVLHPEKYLEEPRDVPVEVAVPDATAALGDGWRLTYYNELGELGISALLETDIRLRESTRASEGWGGDRYGLFENADTGEAVLVWGTRWDTEKDAEEFYKALAHWNDKTGGGEPADVLKGESTRQAPYKDRERIQVLEGKRVFLLDGKGPLIRKVLQSVRGG